MNNQALFSSKDKSKNNKSVICCNFAGALRVNKAVSQGIVKSSCTLEVVHS